MALTDQEQTERGASTVKIDVEAETSAFTERVVGDLEAEVETHRQQLTNVTRLVAYWQAEGERLRADLERVTADLADVANERDVWREQVVLVQAERDAMRKATADATEEGK